MNDQLNFQEKIERIKERCAFDFINLAFFNAHIGSKPAYVSGNKSTRYLRIVLQKRKGLAGQVIKTGRPAFVIDVEKEIMPEDFQDYPIIMAEGLKSLGALPLFEGNQVIGVVLAGFRTINKMTEELIQCFKHGVKQEFASLDNQELV